MLRVLVGGLAVGCAIAAVMVAVFLVDAKESHAVRTINMQAAASMASKEVGKAYWNNREPESAACSHHVPARKGQLFWCQVLLAEDLVPVEMELTSPLGFYRVVKVGRNQRLIAEGQREHQQFVEEREERELTEEAVEKERARREEAERAALRKSEQERLTQIHAEERQGEIELAQSLRESR